MSGLIKDLCSKHGTGSPSGPYSIKIANNITNDISMRPQDAVRVVFMHNFFRFFTVLVDKETFEGKALQCKYYSKNYNKYLADNKDIDDLFTRVFGTEKDNLDEQDEINPQEFEHVLSNEILSIRYICGACVSEYETKHNVRLSHYLVNDVHSFLDYMDDGSLIDPETISHELNV